MPHFANVVDGKVLQVLAITQEVVDSGAFGDPSNWIQTSYNTRGGVHYGPDGNPDGGIPLRKNYAGIGFTYDSVHDAFIPPKPFQSWTLDMETFEWRAPIEPPSDDKNYMWDEKDYMWRTFAEYLTKYDI